MTMTITQPGLHNVMLATHSPDVHCKTATSASHCRILHL